MQLIFATNNKHKLEEARNILGENFQVLSLDDINFHNDIPEDFETLAENASQKSHTIFDYSSLDCFSDDTGLEVEALSGRPGVYSARFAGENATYTDNVNKLLLELKQQKNRKARFHTVISLIIKGEEHFFEGTINGCITDAPKGNNGFGYDPVFIPEGYNVTFAELNSEEKNRLSHRGKALEAMAEFLKTHPVV